MTHRHNLESVERTLRDLFRSVLSLGRIVVLCIGDLTQILRVV